jgi:hypothetical protein
MCETASTICGIRYLLNMSRAHDVHMHQKYVQQERGLQPSFTPSSYRLKTVVDNLIIGFASLDSKQTETDIRRGR